ncbi:Domain of unknown function DUF3835 [Lasallia pustulata]|uniref:DUF3835 domain-containing protein n=1 Tax=Lasallia pustulata TaxID=136370 RepID=A0A1W5CSJ8_9LECA|nr:Domain of unknown function DUF3835 [Lasallia pustulata]
MADPSINFTDLENQRLQLEENVAGLRKSLQYWQTWEAEYEGLKEEFIAFGQEHTPDELEEVGADFGGTLLDEKEIQSLFKDAHGKSRSSQQIVGLLTRRNDYVFENVNTVSKRLKKAEEQLSALKAKGQPMLHNTEGLPITEILEELDEEGNVISSSTTRPGEAAAQVADALRKAGLEEEFPASQTATMLGIDDAKKTLPHEGDSAELQSNGLKPLEAAAAPNYTNKVEDQTSLAMTSEPAAPVGPQSRRKKSVTFAADTKDAEPMAADTRPSSEINVDEIRAATPVKRISGTEHVSDATSESTDKDGSPPIIPTDESLEDAALRRQMLQYSMDEIGAVVAEIDLDESGSQTSYSSEEDGDEQYTSSADEEEDTFGRTTRRVLSDDYLREMQELERKLKARVLRNVGPDMPENLDDLKRPIFDKRPPKKLQPSNAQVQRKKGVRFADELDTSSPPNKEPKTLSTSEHAAPPVHEAVIERAAPRNEASPAPTSGKMLSRFKSSRTAAAAITNNGPPSTNPASTEIVANRPLNGNIQERNPPTGSPSPQLTPPSVSKPHPFRTPIPAPCEDRTRREPEGPPGKTLAETLIERPTVRADADVPEPNQFDPALLHQEVAVEYHKMRIRMVQRDGGFAPQAEEEEERVPLAEEEGGGRKVSRFRAARLRRVG